MASSGKDKQALELAMSMLATGNGERHCRKDFRASGMPSICIP